MTPPPLPQKKLTSKIPSLLGLRKQHFFGWIKNNKESLYFNSRIWAWDGSLLLFFPLQLKKTFHHLSMVPFRRLITYFQVIVAWKLFEQFWSGIKFSSLIHLLWRFHSLFILICGAITWKRMQIKAELLHWYSTIGNARISLYSKYCLKHGVISSH